MTKKRHPKFREGDSAIWNDGVQDIPVRVEYIGRDAVGIYCRVLYFCNDGSAMHDKVHSSQLRRIPGRLS